MYRRAVWAGKAPCLSHYRADSAARAPMQQEYRKSAGDDRRSVMFTVGSSSHTLDPNSSSTDDGDRPVWGPASTAAIRAGDSRGLGMGRTRFNRLARSLTAAGSRRQTFAVLAGSLGLLSFVQRDAAEARKKCPPCKKRKQGKCKGKKPDGTLCAGGACQSGSCVPAAAGPVTAADAACPGPYPTNTLHPRNAQTFRALRSGQLTSASVAIYLNPEGADFDMEIWSVNQANAPNAVLAGTTIANVPETVAPGPRTLTGTFAAPATVVAGLRYALVITGQPGQSFGLLANGSNPCPDGMLFYATTTDGAFTALPTADMGFVTFVTA
jgi:hypothetical protein